MEPVIDIAGLSVTYDSRHGPVKALDGLTLAVQPQHVVGFLGPNGAGKTTTIHTLLGFVEASAGTARILGTDVRHSIARRRIGYLPELPDFYKFLTGRELLFMAGRLFGLDRITLKSRVAALLESVDIASAADRRIGTYSRGMLQRIGIAQALVNDPDLLIFDEPTGGLDPLGRMAVRELIGRLREQGKTVFFSSHELSEVELVCDRIAIVAHGRLVAEGAVNELVKDGQSLEKYFLAVVRGTGDEKHHGTDAGASTSRTSNIEH
ncbi:MAG: ABC transporter ATP-binding protein [Kiritimatiellae bacterium]|nr:ABC transporter ATP-binding protein [Kiritimatiellia bacterium]